MQGALMNYVPSLFDEKLVIDDRDPFIKGLSIPGFDGSFDFYSPRMLFWYQLAYLLIIQVAFLSIYAVIIYSVIIKNRGAQWIFFLGYGVIIPSVVQLPHPLISYLGLTNRALRMSLTTLPCNVTFRCIEAMHGTSPVCVEDSLTNYLIYYSSVVDFMWDEKSRERIKITSRELLQHLWKITIQMLILSPLLSTLFQFDYKPFPSDVVLEDYHLSLDLLKPGQLMNNYIYAITLFFVLSLAFNVGALGNQLQGYKTATTFRNPLFTSRSPSDFWGYRWNMVVHHTLKRGAYKPALVLGYSKVVAILVSFLASGLLHDLCWTILFFKSVHDYDSYGNCIDCFDHLRLKVTMFFLWCGLTMLLEKPIGRLPPVKWMAKNLPRIVVSTLNVLVVLPFVHWFAGDWIVGGYFKQFSMGTFTIVYNPAS